MVFVFIVKLPLYRVHMWLPKAHVEAPVVGSILLAGVLLKLGGYGFYRFFFLLIDFFYNSYMFRGLYYLSLLGGLVVAIICLRQSDVKIIIAYSSVVHMSFAIIGLLSFCELGLLGSLLIFISHGFISPFLFYGLTYIYDRFHSRRIFVLKGVLLIAPIFVFFWCLGIILNIGFPPFISFFSEVSILRGFRVLGGMDFFIVVVFLFFCGAYRIFLYVYSSHGGFTFLERFLCDFKFLFIRMVHIIFVIIFPLIFY